MSKVLKYKWLMDAKSAIDCPFSDCSENSLIAYRWTTGDAGHEDNYLPNHIYNEKKSIPMRFNQDTPTQNCSCCGLSMFSSIEAALKTYKGLPERNKSMLGYSHVSSLTIEKEMGLISKMSKNGHFTFFEYEDISLHSIAKIVQELN